MGIPMGGIAGLGEKRDYINIFVLGVVMTSVGGEKNNNLSDFDDDKKNK